MTAHQIALLSPHCAEHGDQIQMLTLQETATVGEALASLNRDANELRTDGDFIVTTGGGA